MRYSRSTAGRTLRSQDHPEALRGLPGLRWVSRFLHAVHFSLAGFRVQDDATARRSNPRPWHRHDRRVKTRSARRNPAPAGAARKARRPPHTGFPIFPRYYFIYLTLRFTSCIESRVEKRAELLKLPIGGTCDQILLFVYVLPKLASLY